MLFAKRSILDNSLQTYLSTADVKRITPEHTAHGIANKAADLAPQIGAAHGHVLVLNLRREFVREAVDVYKYAVEFFLVLLEGVEPLRRLMLPIGKCRRSCTLAANQRMSFEVP